MKTETGVAVATGGVKEEWTVEQYVEYLKAEMKKHREAGYSTTEVFAINYAVIEGLLAALARQSGKTLGENEPVEHSTVSGQKELPEIPCPLCGKATEVDYHTTGTHIDCIDGDGCHAHIVLPCFPEEVAIFLARRAEPQPEATATDSERLNWLETHWGVIGHYRDGSGASKVLSWHARTASGFLSKNHDNTLRAAIDSAMSPQKDFSGGAENTGLAPSTQATAWRGLRHECPGKDLGSTSESETSDSPAESLTRTDEGLAMEAVNDFDDDVILSVGDRQDLYQIILTVIKKSRQ